MLHSICQQIWKSTQCPQDWRMSDFIPIPKIDNAPQKGSNCHISVLISFTSKVILKILQANPQQYMNGELEGVQGGFWKGRRTRDQIANICWIMGKVREFQEFIYFCLIDFVIEEKLWKILKKMGVTDKPTYILRNLQVKKQQLEPDMEQWTGSKLGKGYNNAVFCHSASVSQFSCSVMPDFATPQTAACQASLSITKS